MVPLGCIIFPAHNDTVLPLGDVSAAAENRGVVRDSRVFNTSEYNGVAARDFVAGPTNYRIVDRLTDPVAVSTNYI